MDVLAHCDPAYWKHLAILHVLFSLYNCNTDPRVMISSEGKMGVNICNDMSQCNNFSPLFRYDELAKETDEMAAEVDRLYKVKH